MNILSISSHLSNYDPHSTKPNLARLKPMTESEPKHFRTIRRPSSHQLEPNKIRYTFTLSPGRSRFSSAMHACKYSITRIALCPRSPSREQRCEHAKRAEFAFAD